MERRQRRDAIKLVIRKLRGHRIGLDKFYVRIKFRAFTSDANHLRRQVDGENLFGTPGKQAGESSRAATDFKDLPALPRNPAQQISVIVRVMIPDFVGEQSNPIKIGLN